MFVHFDIFHIGFNMIALYYFGRLNEISYSRGEYLAIYFGAGLLGNALSLFLIPLDVQTGGASGAIFGLVGSYAARNHSAVNIALALVYAAFIFIASSGPGSTSTPTSSGSWAGSPSACSSPGCARRSESGDDSSYKGGVGRGDA